MSYSPPVGGCEIEPPKGFYCSREFHHEGPCANWALPAGKPEDRPGNVQFSKEEYFTPPLPKGEKSGGPVSYYLVHVTRPNQGDLAYQAECGDIIEALGMDFNEGCEFKAIWRTAAARTLGKVKEGGDARYDAEKRVFYAKRSLAQLNPVDYTPKTQGFVIRGQKMTLQEAQDLIQYAVDNVEGFPAFLEGMFPKRMPEGKTWQRHGESGYTMEVGFSKPPTVDMFRDMITEVAKMHDHEVRANGSGLTSSFATAFEGIFKEVFGAKAK